MLIFNFNFIMKDHYYFIINCYLLINLISFQINLFFNFIITIINSVIVIVIINYLIIN